MLLWVMQLCDDSEVHINLLVALFNMVCTSELETLIQTIILHHHEQFAKTPADDIDYKDMVECFAGSVEDFIRFPYQFPNLVPESERFTILSIHIKFASAKTKSGECTFLLPVNLNILDLPVNQKSALASREALDLKFAPLAVADLVVQKKRRAASLGRSATRSSAKMKVA